MSISITWPYSWSGQLAHATLVEVEVAIYNTKLYSHLHRIGTNHIMMVTAGGGDFAHGSLGTGS